MQTVTFSVGHPPYNAGETAAFPDEDAAALVAAGVAAPSATAAEPDPLPAADSLTGAETIEGSAE